MTARTLSTTVVAVALVSAGVAWSHARGGEQPESRSPRTAAAVARHQVPFTRLGPGHCFNAAAVARLQDTVTVVPCAAPHLHEAFAVVSLKSAPGAPYPGNATLRQRIRSACEQALIDVRQTSLGDTSYGLFPVIPIDATTWKNGNRRLVCALFSIDMRPAAGHLPAVSDRRP